MKEFRITATCERETKTFTVKAATSRGARRQAVALAVEWFKGKRFTLGRPYEVESHERQFAVSAA